MVENSISKLNNYCQKNKLPTPEYSIDQSRIDEEDGKPRFYSEVSLNGVFIRGKEDLNHKAAKINAASKMLKNIEKGISYNFALFIDIENLPSFFESTRKMSRNIEVYGFCSSNFNCPEKLKKDKNVFLVNSKAPNVSDTALIMYLTLYIQKNKNRDIFIATNDQKYSDGLKDCLENLNFLVFKNKVRVFKFFNEFKT